MPYSAVGHMKHIKSPFKLNSVNVIFLKWGPLALYQNTCMHACVIRFTWHKLWVPIRVVLQRQKFTEVLIPGTNSIGFWQGCRGK